jgi:arylsulfatase A-like enzyme
MQKVLPKKEILTAGLLVWLLSGLIFGIADSIAISFSKVGLFTIGENVLAMATSIGGFIGISLIAYIIITPFFIILFSFQRKYPSEKSILILQMCSSFSLFLLFIAMIFDKRSLREMIAFNLRNTFYNLIFLFIYLALIFGFYRLIQWRKTEWQRLSIFGSIQFFIACLGLIHFYAIKLYKEQRIADHLNLKIALICSASIILSIFLYLMLRIIFKSCEARKSFTGLSQIVITISSIFVIIAFIYATINIPRGFHISYNSPSKPPANHKMNCLFILIDDLRMDHLSCYGYYRKTSPNLDSLAAKGVRFEQAITSSSHTSASVPTIFTSLYPAAHGARVSTVTAYGLSPEQKTLTSILAQHGYITAAFIANNPFIKLSGINRGFDTYFDGNIFAKLPTYSIFFQRIVRKFLVRDVRAENLNKIVMKWLKKNYQYSFFLYIHYMDVHYPMLPYKEHIKLLEEQAKLDITKFKGYPFRNKEDAEKLYSIISRYDGDIRYLDAHIGRLMNYLKSLALTEETLVIIAADHGEELQEHGSIGHGAHLYDEVIRVPLIFYIPSRIQKPTIISQQVGTIDIMPTILDLLDIPAPPLIQGKSLVPLISGISADEERYIFGGQGSFVRTTDWKLIYNKETNSYELYDLKSDPYEQNNLIDTQPEIAARLKFSLAQHIKKSKKFSINPSKASFTEDITKRLKTLGYITH